MQITSKQITVNILRPCISSLWPHMNVNHGQFHNHWLKTATEAFELKCYREIFRVPHAEGKQNIGSWHGHRRSLIFCVKNKTTTVLQYTSNRNNEKWQRLPLDFNVPWWVVVDFAHEFFLKIKYNLPIRLCFRSNKLPKNYWLKKRDYMVLLSSLTQDYFFLNQPTKHASSTNHK